MLSAALAADAEPLTIAVASNFRLPAEAIVEKFVAATGHEVRLSSASTGKLATQIANGAPFDVFLAADQAHPERLEQAGLAVPGTRFTYATGALVLYSRDPELEGRECRSILDAPGKRRLAIANPRVAPYGIAARQFLEAEGLWDRLETHLVYGENIAQALHFVASGNAELGLIAYSQAIDARLPPASCSYRVPDDRHEPLAQQAIVLRRAADNAAALAFVEFLAGEESAEIILRFGYGGDA